MLQPGPAKKLIIYVDESDKHKSRPVHEVVVELLFTNKVAGASVFRGMAGYGSHGHFHTSKLLELSTDLPVKIEVVDSAESIENVLPLLSAIIAKGIIEVSDTVVIKCARPSTFDSNKK